MRETGDRADLSLRSASKLLDSTVLFLEGASAHLHHDALSPLRAIAHDIAGINNRHYAHIDGDRHPAEPGPGRFAWPPDARPELVRTLHELVERVRGQETFWTGFGAMIPTLDGRADFRRHARVPLEGAFDFVRRASVLASMISDPQHVPTPQDFMATAPQQIRNTANATLFAHPVRADVHVRITYEKTRRAAPRPSTAAFVAADDGGA